MLQSMGLQRVEHNLATEQQEGKDSIYARPWNQKHYGIFIET